MKKTLTVLLALLLMVMPIASLAQEEEEKVLNILTWEGYIDNDTILAPFTAETGIKINYAHFSQNEEMLAKLEATGGADYDIILAGDYVLNIARKAGLLQPFNKDLIPNLVNIKPSYMGNYFDPDSEYTVPYVSGSPLIVYDPSMVDVEIKSYADLWDPSLADSIVTIDDARIMVGFTLKSLGYSMNSTNDEELAEAKARLMELRPNIRALAYDAPDVVMLSGEATVGLMFTPFVYSVTQSRPEFVVVYPTEGLGYGIDGLAIPAKAPHPNNANAFLDFLLRPEIGAAIAEVQNYPIGNAASTPLLDEAYVNNPVLNIPEDKLGNYEFVEDVGDYESVYLDIWTEFKQGL